MSDDREARILGSDAARAVGRFRPGGPLGYRAARGEGVSALRIGELCAGYGGLGLGIQAALGGEVVWVSDIDKGANKILTHCFPGVPNHGDMTAVDWTTVEPVDVLAAGYPCQPFSHAGKRKGTNDERHLWPTVREAIRVLRPRLTLLENVAGHRSLGFDRVLGDLAEDGMHVQWASIRASDIGAPHRRERLFILVTDPNREGLGSIGRLYAKRRDSYRRSLENGLRSAAQPATLLSTPQARDYKGVPGDGFNVANLCRDVSLLPTPRATDGTKGGPNQRGSSGDLLLPTPKASNFDGSTNDGYTPNLRERIIEMQRLLPTPQASDPAVRSEASARKGADSGFGDLAGQALHGRWGQYADAIARWEHVLGRPAPVPTQPSKKGTPQLAPAFSEWMMGLPAGHVTDVPGLSRNEMLKALGNGVVPAHAAAALRLLLNVSESVA